MKDEFYETELIPIIDVCEEAQFSNLEELKQIIYKMWYIYLIKIFKEYNLFPIIY